MLKILKTFYGFMLTKKLAFAGFILLVVVATALSNLSPYFYKIFVETIPTLNYEKLLSILLIFMLVRIASWVLGIFSYIAGDYVLIDASIDARIAIFKYVQDLDFAFHSEKSTGSLISAFKRGDGALWNLFHAIHHRMTEVAVSLLVMIYFFSTLDLRIVLVIVISFLLTLVAIKFLIGLNVKRRVLFNKKEDEISGIIVDNLINFETVKLFSKENWERNRLRSAFVSWKRSAWDYFNSYRLIDVTIGIITNLTFFLIILMSLRFAVDFKFSIGDFVLVSGFIGIFFPRLWDLVWSFRDIAKSYADISKYFGILDNDIQVKDPKVPIKRRSVHGEIEYKKVHFSYKGRSKNAVNGLTLKIRQGQSIALVGRSGSGKTTLVKLLMRFYDLDGGKITIDGVNISAFTKRDLRSFIGVVPQEPILFNNTISYNIGYGKGGATLSEIKAAAALAKIDTFIESLPKKYQTYVGERGIKLSGGQKQRLAIARMILSDPDIIIFDEATSQLDSVSEKLIQEAFWKASKGKTTIIIAHRLSTVMRADKIVVMEKGKIKEIGSHGELLSKKESLYRHFWNLQIKLD